jgi:hypothetical protein
MKTLSKKMREDAVKDLTMYFGKPPYDIEHIRYYRSSGLFEQQALAKYGMTPIELIQTIQAIHLSEETKEEAKRDIAMYFGEPPVSKDMIDKRLSSGLFEMQVLAKYSLTIDELIKEAGIEVSH